MSYTISSHEDILYRHIDSNATLQRLDKNVVLRADWVNYESTGTLRFKLAGRGVEAEISRDYLSLVRVRPEPLIRQKTDTRITIRLRSGGRSVMAVPDENHTVGEGTPLTNIPLTIIPQCPEFDLSIPERARFKFVKEGFWRRIPPEQLQDVLVDIVTTAQYEEY